MGDFLPHRHSNAPSVGTHFFEGVVAQLSETIRRLTQTLAMFEDKVSNEFATMSDRLQRLDSIYVIVDFLNIENVCDQMFADGAQEESWHQKQVSPKEGQDSLLDL